VSIVVPSLVRHSRLVSPNWSLRQARSDRTIALMTDINWPDWSRDGQRLLELMPALRRPSLTRGEVLALADAWASVWLKPDYEAARKRGVFGRPHRWQG